MTQRNYHQEHMERLERGENLSPQDINLKLHIDQSRAKYHSAARDLLKELREKGFAVDTVQDLRAGGKKYKKAIPILSKWLPLVEYEPLKEDIVRTMSVSWASPAFNVLLEEFRKHSSKQDEDYRWIVGYAMGVVAKKTDFPVLAEVALDYTLGAARQMIIRALWKNKDEDALRVLIELLKRGDEVEHVIYALQRLKKKVPVSLINPYVLDSKPKIRKEAKKLLELQDKLDAQEP